MELTIKQALEKGITAHRKGNLNEAANIVKSVIIFILEKFWFLTKAPYTSNNIPLINKINSGNIEFKFNRFIML